jgi:probable F420-dependent oxidoreductase
MPFPLVGIGLPIIEPLAGPAAIRRVALAADRFGFHSVGTYDRLLVPATPGWRNDAGLPEHAAFDVLETLTWVAALTERVRLVTGVLNALFQPPVLLARRLATLDRLSGGRLDAGLGQGWLPKEFAVSGVPPARRGAGFEEYLEVLRACWTPGPVEHGGPRYPVARALIGPKPAGRVPILIGAVAPAAVERAARLGDGLIIGFLSWESTEEQLAIYRAAGGDGRIVLRAGPPGTAFLETTIGKDLARAADLGVTEVIWDLNVAGIGVEAQLAAFEDLAFALGTC